MLWKPWETTTEDEDKAAQGPGLTGMGGLGGRPCKPKASVGGLNEEAQATALEIRDRRLNTERGGDHNCRVDLGQVNCSGYRKVAKDV